MKKILCSLLLMGSLAAQDLFKFSTIYGAYSFTSPVTKEQQFTVSGGQLQEILDERDDHSIMTFGIRKLARFGYENKPEVWFDGSEAAINESVAIGNIAKGWEYVVEYSDHKAFEENFTEQEVMLRYLGDKFIIKTNYDYRGLEDLEFAAIDMRYRLHLGSLDLSLGVAGRSHPAYLDFLPIDLYWAEQDINPDEFIPFWLLAWDEAGYADGPYKDEWTQQFTQFGYEFYDWYWTDAEGNIVATTDQQFYELVYGDLVEDYNEQFTKELGYQNELSLSVGMDYYKYNPKNWIHIWATTFPITKGLSDYSYNYEIADSFDYDLGLVYGWKLTNKFGVFLEGRYLNMYGIKSYEAKTGLNILIY
tara:strand:+ start:127 stop:1212 length:1086 start_codon:yes stop_codon:yes gene_type:complete